MLYVMLHVMLLMLSVVFAMMSNVVLTWTIG